MGYVVAIEAFREFLQNAGGVRRVMATLAGGDRFMFSGMAEYTSQFVMLRLVGAEQLHGLLVASAA